MHWETSRRGTILLLYSEIPIITIHKAYMITAAPLVLHLLMLPWQNQNLREKKQNMNPVADRPLDGKFGRPHFHTEEASSFL